MELVSNGLDIKLVSWYTKKKVNGIKWEDFISNIDEYITLNKEQILQQLLEDESLFLYQECLEEDVLTDEYKNSININNNIYNYPIVSSSTIDIFRKLNKKYRKYFKKNLNETSWCNFLEKVQKGVKYETLDKIWRFECEIKEYIPIFIIDNEVDLDTLSICEKVVPQTFYFIFFNENKLYLEWLEDHHGHIVKQNDAVSKYQKRQELMNSYHFWEKSKWAIFIDKNIKLRASVFYYMMYLLQQNKEVKYVTPYALDKNGNYFSRSDLQADTIPEKFKTIQEVESAYGGFCIIDADQLQYINLTSNNFFHICSKINGKKIVFKL